jgi:hypothetical protein
MTAQAKVNDPMSMVPPDDDRQTSPKVRGVCSKLLFKEVSQGGFWPLAS